MSKLSLIILLAVVCTLEANNYFYYPSAAGALNYQYNPYAPYVYSAYAVPVDCDKSTSDEGGSKESSESSSESESKEGGESESSSESSEGGESKEEGSSSEGSSEEKKEGESSSESSSSEESGEKKEEGKKEEGKKENKSKTVKYIFPPVSYPFPPTPAQQVIYSNPSYGYLPYRTYSAIQQPAIKSSGYNYQPYYAGSYSAPVARIVNSPVNRVASYPGLTKTITFAPASGVGGPAGYWNGNVGYYKA